jgi:hypothetical protein
MGIQYHKMGHYGTPIKITTWISQLYHFNSPRFVFLAAWVWVKTLVMLSLNLSLVQLFGKWILTPIANSSSDVQIVVIVFVIPIILNILQAWLTDVVIKGYELVDEEVVDVPGGRDIQDDNVEETHGNSRKPNFFQGLWIKYVQRGYTPLNTEA